MKNILHRVVLILVLGSGSLTIQSQSTLSLVESSGGCGMVTNCTENTVCFDIMLTPGVNADVLSYNIWLKYPETGLSYVADSACITQNGADNNLDIFGYYRVSGVLGSAMVEAGIEIAIHTVCFTYESIDSIENNNMSVGGSLYAVLHSPVTYDNPASNESMLPDFPFVLSENEVSCLILPVTWLSFEVHKKGEASILQWTTAQEFNNAGFHIERSVDGRHFSPIGQIGATKNPQPVNTYSFTDEDPSAGINYYRIRQVDFDGASSLSEIRHLNFRNSSDEFVSWPNPVSEQLYIEIPEYAEGGQISLVNASGITVLTTQYNDEDVQTVLDLQKIEPGLYSLVIKSTDYHYTEKIVVFQ